MEHRTPSAVQVAVFLSLLITPLMSAANPDLTGTYLADDGGIYYVQQSGTVLWWSGMSLDAELNPDLQWHRGLKFTNVFRGTINADNTITGEWSDVTRGVSLGTGKLTLAIDAASSPVKLTKTSATGGFGASVLTQTAPLDDTKFNGNTLDLYSRFDQVHKNDADECFVCSSGSTILDNLKPYRDATVVYGHVITRNPELDLVFPLTNPPKFTFDDQAPHVNYGGSYGSPIPGSFRDFGHGGREFKDFTCFTDGDADFDFRLKIDLDKLEPHFWDTGWGDANPDIIRWKFNHAATRAFLGFAGNEAYLGTESIMYGRPGTCSGIAYQEYLYSIGAIPFPDVSGGLSMLPGWADLFSNSILVNGRPVNGLFDRLGPADPSCDFTSPCPYLNGGSADYLNYGIQLGTHRITATTNGAYSSAGDTYMRVTGPLILDCGHGITHDCSDDPDDPDDDAETQNQEIHPIYSIDIIDHPFRPEDASIPRVEHSLTGTWGGNDGSTYYVRQIGNTIWWYGLYRDRQPIQRGNTYDILGLPQVAAAGLLIGSPLCATNSECWMFANVFKGNITENADGSATIQGDWAGVPQSSSPGSTGSNLTFNVSSNRKLMTPATLQGLFPDTLEKLYEPEEDTVPPQSNLTVGTPVYTTGSFQRFITSATPLTITSTDQGSGVLNVWYRFFPTSAQPSPGYSPILGSTGTFYLTGSDGDYNVESFATDYAGNDEFGHGIVRLFTLDNTAPLISIVQPTATQYTHSSTLTISFAVSDGSGSGVQNSIATLDGNIVSNNQQIDLLTSLLLGDHTFSLTATDNVGNSRTSTVKFSIIVTAQSIIDDVTHFVGSGKVGNGIPLTSKLDAAARNRAAGNCNAANNDYQAFINQVNALSGKSIDPAAAMILVADAQYLMSHCP